MISGKGHQQEPPTYSYMYDGEYNGAKDKRHNGGTEFVKRYVGIPDMHLVPLFLCIIVFMMAAMFVMVLIGVFALTANSGSAHEMVTYVHTISDLTRDVKNASDFVRINIPQDTNFSQVVQNISVAVRTAAPKDIEEWANITAGAKQTIRSASSIVKSVDDSNVFFAAGNLLSATEDVVKRPSFIRMMETTERFVPTVMEALGTDKAVEAYQILLNVLDYIPSVLDVVVPWFTGDVKHEQIDELKVLLHIFTQPDVSGGIAAVGDILTEIKHIIHELYVILEDDVVKDNLEKVVHDLGEVRWKAIGETVIDCVHGIQQAAQGERGHEAIDAAVGVVREVGHTIKAIRTKVDSGDAVHAFREVVDLLDTFNRVSHLLTDKQRAD